MNSFRIRPQPRLLLAPSIISHNSHHQPRVVSLCAPAGLIESTFPSCSAVYKHACMFSSRRGRRSRHFCPSIQFKPPVGIGANPAVVPFHRRVHIFVTLVWCNPIMRLGAFRNVLEGATRRAQQTQTQTQTLPLPLLTSSSPPPWQTLSKQRETRLLLQRTMTVLSISSQRLSI
jgi:hypothetical protein